MNANIASCMVFQFFNTNKWRPHTHATAHACTLMINNNNNVSDGWNQAIDGLNVYDILEPCYHDPATAAAKGNGSLPLSFQQLGDTDKPLPVRKRMFGRAWPFKAPVRDGLVPLWPQLAETRHIACVVSYSSLISMHVQINVLYCGCDCNYDFDFENFQNQNVVVPIADTNLYLKPNVQC